MCSICSCATVIRDRRCCFLPSYPAFISPIVYQTCPCLTQRVGLAWLRLPAALCLAVGVCCSAPLLLLTCHSHVARTVFPLSCWPNHATAPCFFFPFPALTHTHAHTRSHTCEPAIAWDRVRCAHQHTIPLTHTEEFRFCLWKERMANSRQLEVLKTINYRVTRLKDSKRAALCEFSLCEWGWRVCRNCCADQQTAI